MASETDAKAMRLALGVFLFMSATAAHAKFPVFGSGSFGQVLAIGAVILALILWRQSPAASIVILSIVAAFVLKSVYPLAGIAACLLYLLFENASRERRSRKGSDQVERPEYEGALHSFPDRVLTYREKPGPENPPHKWIRLSEGEFLELGTPNKLHSSEEIKVILQPIGTGILYKRQGAGAEVFIPEDSIKDFWKY